MQLLEATSDVMGFSHYLCCRHANYSVTSLSKGRLLGLLDRAVYRCHLAFLTTFCGRVSVLYLFLGEESARGVYTEFNIDVHIRFIW